MPKEVMLMSQQRFCLLGEAGNNTGTWVLTCIGLKYLLNADRGLSLCTCLHGVGGLLLLLLR